MKKILTLSIVALSFLLLASCVTAARIARKNAEKVAEWKKANPKAELTPEVLSDLQAIAEAEAHGEVAEERKAALAKGTEAAGRFASGDIVGGVLALIGLGGIAYGAYKKQSAA